MKYVNQQLIKLARMAGSRVILVCLLICSLSNAYSINDTATINITLKEYRKPVPDNSLVGKAIISHQPYENRTCFPESWNMLLKQRMITVPNIKCSPVEILKCYCLTLESISSDMDNGSLQNMNFGKCFYGCFSTVPNYNTHYQVHLVDQLEKGKCALFNRKGILCGKCKDGHGPAVYSFSLKCVECGNSTHWTRVPLYILIAYGPLTVFLGVIVVFTISVNSAPLHGWILVCQLLSTNSLMRLLSSIDLEHISPHCITLLLKLLGSTYGIWNLDFFRFIYTPFCLHPSLSTLHVISLDYIIAAYPLVLIIVMYFLVEMYSRNYRPVVIVFRPFHYCFTRFRHQLYIRTSLVDAFGTFFSLSYMKFFSTTIDLLTPTQVWNFNGSSYHVYYDGTMEYFKGRHIPYALLGVLVCLLCNILPLILILLYSFRKTHVILNCLPLSVRTMLFPFMDNILACYKDGTNGTRNCRYFGLVYHLAYIVILSGFALTKSMLMVGVNAFMCILIGILVAVIRPYKSEVYNIVDTVLILTVGLGFVAGMSLWMASDIDPQNMVLADMIAVVPLNVPLLYFIGYVALKIRRRCFRSLHFIVVKMKASLGKMTRRITEMGGISENTPLVQQPKHYQFT